MPRRTSQGDRHPLLLRLLAALLAGLLSVPALPAQPADENDKPNSKTSDAQKVPDGADQKSSAPVPVSIDDTDRKIRPDRLACRDPELTSDDVLPSHRSTEADKWGDITVAQPKIWQFERVSALLDGLLRDVEGVSLGDLTQLDPSQQNAAALKFIQSALEVGVQYDQAAAVNSANILNSYNTLHASQTQQLEQYNNYMQTLTVERDRLAAQYSGASNEVNSLQALQAAGPLTAAQSDQLAAAISRQTTTQASLTSVNSLISGAGAAPTLTAPPTVTGTSVQGPASGSNMSSSLMGFSDVLKSLPSGVQNNLSAALNAPSYPATKRLDNFITLLYERLAREISVLQDDLTRDPDNVAFLLQFDVGLYPSKKAKDHVARVEFNLDCPGCKVYSLYPGQSSYNLANYSGASKRNTFWGNALTLIGFGVSASYRRQTDTLQGSLVQSVYTAGFQNGVMNEDSLHPRQQVDANQAEQSFGWYYGAAPFEQLVTPGIRSTFALITVPRKLIARTADKFGNADACVPFHIDAGWANRNDPVAQDSYVSAVGRSGKGLRIPFYFPTRKELLNPNIDSYGDALLPASGRILPYDTSVLTMMTSVKLPASLDDYSLIASREKKMHVLRMEYNTAYEQPDPAASATVVQTTVQTSTQSTNLATGQSTGQTTSQTTGTAVAAGNAAAGNAAVGVSSTLNPLPCPKGKCAPILLKLDRPIDPNLVVTVRGEPLMRVRDWRGRATSVLPPAQSGTDLASSASAPGSLTLKQLQQTRSLLESDQFAPNTWFALNSHELLLNVSVDVATDKEFPVIQLSDPSGSLVIPYDLRRSFTELIVDEFRLRPQSEYSIQREVGRQNWRDDDGKTCPNGADTLNCIITSNKGDASISSGPYAFSTYTPLFSPLPVPRRFFAMVGETGDDLLIGFLPRPQAQKETDKSPHFDWLEAQTRVILEERNQDFAWSLSCDVQGDLLACRMPREEISRSYLNFLRACPDDTVCPGLDMDRQSLVQSLREEFERQTRSGLLTDAEPCQIRGSTAINPKTIGAQQQLTIPCREQLDKEEQAIEARAAKVRMQTKLLKTAGDLKDFRNAFVSTMQLWVEQSDEEGKNVFYSPEPVRIGFLPLSNDYWRTTPFKPWEFEEADADSVTLKECNYLPDVSQESVQASVLGVRSWPAWIGRSASKEDSKEQVDDRSFWTHVRPHPTLKHCGRLILPTAALANDPLMISMEFPTTSPPPECPPPEESAVPILPSKPQPGPCPQELNRPIRTTVALPRMRLGPRFKESEIRVLPNPQPPSSGGNPPVEPKPWEIVIPVEHSTCADVIEPPLDAEIKVEWWEGAEKLTPCPHGSGINGDWGAADEADRVSLHLEISRAAMKYFPTRVNVLRTDRNGVTWAVGTLPNLRELLLPSRLTLEPLGATLFALRGENATVIDAVAMQSSDGSGTTFRTAAGVDFALVTLPPPSADTSSADKTGSGTASGSSTQITVDTTKDNTGHVVMNMQSSTTPAKAAAPGQNQPNTPSSDDKTAAPKPLAPGSYAVIPLMIVGYTRADQSKLDAKDQKAAAVEAAEAKLTAANKALASANGASAAEKATKQKAADDAKTKATDAQKAATAAAKAAEPTPNYMPLNVTDEKGKPLIFTIADPKKQNASAAANATPASTTTTCVAPCAVLPCTASCPPVLSPAVTPKSQ